MNDTSTTTDPTEHAQSVLDSIRAAIDALQPPQSITIAVWDCAPAEVTRIDPGDGTLIFMMTPSKLCEIAPHIEAPEPVLGAPSIPWAGVPVVDLDAGGDAADALKAKIAEALGRGR